MGTLRWLPRGQATGFEDTGSFPHEAAPLELIRQASSADATLQNQQTVPNGEVWRLFSIATINQTTAASQHDAAITVLGTGAASPLSRNLNVAANQWVVTIPATKVYLWPGDIISGEVTDPGLGDTKVATISFQRYYLQPDTASLNRGRPVL